MAVSKNLGSFKSNPIESWRLCLIGPPQKQPLEPRASALPVLFPGRDDIYGQGASRNSRPGLGWSIIIRTVVYGSILGPPVYGNPHTTEADTQSAPHNSRAVPVRISTCYYSLSPIHSRGHICATKSREMALAAADNRSPRPPGSPTHERCDARFVSFHKLGCPMLGFL